MEALLGSRPVLGGWWKEQEDAGRCNLFDTDLTVSQRRPGAVGAAGGEELWWVAPGLNTARGVDTDFSEQERLIWGDSGSEIRGDFKEVASVLTLGGRCIWKRQSVRGRRGKAGLCGGDPCVLPGRLGVGGARP